MQRQQCWHSYCFAILGSTSIVTHSVKQRLLGNQPGSDTATSRAKDYKGHSLVQTSFIEPPNTTAVLFMRRKGSCAALTRNCRVPVSEGCVAPVAQQSPQLIARENLPLSTEAAKHNKNLSVNPSLNLVDQKPVILSFSLFDKNLSVNLVDQKPVSQPIIKSI